MKKKTASYAESSVAASASATSSCSEEKTVSHLAALDREVASLLAEATRLVELYHLWSSPDYKVKVWPVEWFTLAQDLYAIYSQLRDHGVTLNYILVRSDAAKERSHAH